MNADSKKLQNTEKRLPPAAGKGRPKGALNKTTAVLKDAILRAAQRAGGGGEDGIENYLAQQAEKNSSAFIGLLGKILPSEMVAAIATTSLTKEQRDAVAAAFARRHD